MAVEVGKAEEEILDRMVESGFFESEDEAVRAAVLKYASELGFMDRKQIWNQIGSRERRDVSPGQLKQDLEKIEE
jgi:Arc/MetJ-type ribon-helix-helix transcriptional regulator